MCWYECPNEATCASTKLNKFAFPYLSECAWEDNATDLFCGGCRCDCDAALSVCTTPSTALINTKPLNEELNGLACEPFIKYEGRHRRDAKNYPARSQWSREGFRIPYMHMCILTHRRFTSHQYRIP